MRDATDGAQISTLCVSKVRGAGDYVLLRAGDGGADGVLGSLASLAQSVIPRVKVLPFLQTTIESARSASGRTRRMTR